MNSLSMGKKAGIAIGVLIILVAVVYYFDIRGMGTKMKSWWNKEKLSNYPFTGTFYDVYNRRVGSVR